MTRYVWDKKARKGKGAWVSADKYRADSHARRLQVVADIQPYQSAVTGEVIGGRRQHRDHLRAHGLEEVGNEKLSPKKYEPMPSAAPDVAHAFRMMQERGR